MRKPTANDVANRAEVSRSAVSLVLSGRAKQARLSKETEARIRQAAAELHYKPNASGQSLKNGRTETIGLVIRDLTLLDVDPFLLPLLNGILQRSRAEGYRVLVESPDSNSAGDAFGDLMDSGRIDGMIVKNANYGDKSLRRLIKSGRPIVVLGSQGVKEEWSVGIEDEQGGWLATHHLISRGRRHIAHIGFSSPGIYAVDERHAGYLRALQEAGLKPRRQHQVSANFSMESGYAAMRRLLTDRVRPDGVFATSDAVALGAVAAIKDHNLKVPDDIALVGFDNIGAAAFSRPSLTTVTSNPHRTGELAADMLIGLISGKRPALRQQIIKCELIERGTTIAGHEASS